jgi:small subunit ribosomal protein S17
MADEDKDLETEETPSAEATADTGAEVEAEAVAEAAVPAQAAEPAEPEVQLSPKERRQVSRERKAAKAAPRATVTPEERQAERDSARARKAASRRIERAAARAKYKAGEHERRPTPPREHVVGNQKTRQGVVVSDRADKTITVRIDVARRHRRYEKIVRTSNTVHVHDERNDAHVGDTVIVREARPLSRTKRWRLIEVVERAR